MIPHAVQVKAPLIDAARDGRAAEVFGDQHIVGRAPVDVPDAYLPGLAARLEPDGDDVAAEREDRALHTPAGQIFLHLVRGVALGDAAEVDHHALRQRHGVALNRKLGIVHLLRRGLQLVGVRKHGGAGGEVPQRGGRRDGHVEGAVRHLTDLQSGLQDRDGIVRNGNRFPLGMVDAPYVTVLLRAGQQPVIAPALLQRVVQNLFVVRIGRQRDDRVHIKAADRLFLRVGGKDRRRQQRRHQHGRQKKAERFFHPPGFHSYLLQRLLAKSISQSSGGDNLLLLTERPL